MAAETVSKGARRFVAVGACFLPAGALALLVGAPRAAVEFALFGFVLTTVFGKAYSLVPTYFDRTLAFPRAPTAQFPLTVAGTVGLAVGPLLLAVGLPSGPVVHAGAVLESVAVLAFAATFLVLFARSPRNRVGLYGVLAGVLFGVLGVALGVTMAFVTLDSTVLRVHRTVNLFGFLGLTIVGVSYQFYPPAVGSFPGGSDRTAYAALILGLFLDRYWR